MSQMTASYAADAIGRIAFVLELKLAPGGSVTDYLLELFKTAQSLEDQIQTLENHVASSTSTINGDHGARFFVDGKLINVPAAVQFCAGALARINALISATSQDLDALREDAIKLEVAIRRIAKGASYWPSLSYDLEKLGKPRQRIDYDGTVCNGKIYELGSGSGTPPSMRQSPWQRTEKHPQLPGMDLPNGSSYSTLEETVDAGNPFREKG